MRKGIKIGCLPISLTIAFVIAKVAFGLTWSWWWILAIFFGPIVLGFAVLGLGAIIMMVWALYDLNKRS